MSNWDKSIRRYAEKQDSDYVEICNCHIPERFLRFDTDSKEYYGVSGCEKEFVCAKLQINKHKITITSRRRKLLDPLFHQKKKNEKIRKNPSDLTLDEFFAE